MATTTGDAGGGYRATVGTMDVPQGGWVLFSGIMLLFSGIWIAFEGLFARLDPGLVSDDVNRPPDHLGADLDRGVARREGRGCRACRWSQRERCQTAGEKRGNGRHGAGVLPTHRIRLQVVDFAATVPGAGLWRRQVKANVRLRRRSS